MKKTLRIARLTFKEAMSRRLIPAGIAVSLLYIVLFAVAYNFAQDRGAQAITGQRSRVLVGLSCVAEKVIASPLPAARVHSAITGAAGLTG